MLKLYREEVDPNGTSNFKLFCYYFYFILLLFHRVVYSFFSVAADSKNNNGEQLIWLD